MELTVTVIKEARVVHPVLGATLLLSISLTVSVQRDCTGTSLTVTVLAVLLTTTTNKQTRLSVESVLITPAQSPDQRDADVQQGTNSSTPPTVRCVLRTTSARLDPSAVSAVLTSRQRLRALGIVTDARSASTGRIIRVSSVLHICMEMGYIVLSALTSFRWTRGCVTKLRVGKVYLMLWSLWK